jgi:HSP20 family protein
MVGRDIERRETWPDTLWDRLFAWEPRRPFGRWLEESDMKLEEFTEGDQVVVRAELPGIDPDKDVQVNIHDHTLEISAQRREEKKSEDKGRYRSEFRYGSFTRQIALPADADEHDVKATYRDGVLEVRLPIDKEREKATKVPVERG